MTEFMIAVASAFWLGILTSISPCPMATNIAAISFVGRRVDSPFKVFLAEHVPLYHTHRIIGPDGAVYRILAYRKSERVDALMEIDVVRLSRAASEGATG